MALAAAGERMRGRSRRRSTRSSASSPAP